MQHKSKRYEPYNILTYDAETSIKKAAQAKDEGLYAEIKDLDLISKEFKVHKHCYREFTRDCNKDESSENGQTASYDKGNFEAVASCVANEIIKFGKVVSMKHLHGLYELGVGDSRYTSKLKERLKTYFGDSIVFLSRKNRDCTELVVGTEHIDQFVICTPNQTLERAAEILANDTLKKFNDNSEVPWPPTTEELSSNKWTPPDSIYTFLTALFKHGIHNYITNAQKRWINSIACDMVYGITNGQLIQLKHFLLAIGLHDLTGSRKVVDIVHRLGHCLSYNMSCEIKTAVAERTLDAKQMEFLPLQPSTDKYIAPTYFWVDNFDVQVDRLVGGGSINNTHLMAFQEVQEGTQLIENNISVPRKKSRQIFYEDLNIPIMKIDNNKEPPHLAEEHIFDYCENEFNMFHFLWAYLRKKNSFNQLTPSLKGWLLQIREVRNVVKPTKTIETFLPPITSKVTDFATIQKYLNYLQQLSSSVNMPYVNVTLDVGAAINEIFYNAFKTVWNHPEVYRNVVIHLGGFHFSEREFSGTPLKCFNGLQTM